MSQLYPTGSVVLEAEGNQLCGKQDRCVFSDQADTTSWGATTVTFRAAVVS